MTEVIIKTQKKREVIDITEEINDILAKQKVKDGLVYLFVTHTTASLTTADLDPGTDLDMLDALEVMMPKLQYRHPHDPSHVPDHIFSSIIGMDLMVPFKNYKLTLGTWQCIILIELNGPRERRVIISII